MSELAILFPQADIKVGERTITVRELAWGEALGFLRMLGEHAGKLVNERGDFALKLDEIGEIVAGSEELADYLIAKATGLTAEEIDALPLGVGIELLDKALELNLSQDLAKKAAGLAARLRGMASLEVTRRSSISSSGKDTAGATSSDTP